MLKKVESLFLLLLASSTIANSCLAATYQVLPGEDTLYDAIQSAQDNDILLLSTGTYSFDRFNNNLSITKSLTIRAKDKDNHPLIFLRSYIANFSHQRGSLSLGGSGNIIFQGVEIGSSNDANINFHLISCSGTGEIEFLQSTISGAKTNFDCRRDSGQLMMIANQIAFGTRLNLSASEVILAGNTISNGSINIEDSDQAWVIGNTVNHPLGINTFQRAINLTADNSHVIGNRLGIVANTTGNNTTHWTGVNCSNCTVANNIIDVDVDADSTINGISAGGGASRVYNNIVIKNGDSSTADTFAIRVGEGMDVANNIVIDQDSEMAIMTGNIASARHNICFETKQPCIVVTGNLNTDPGFLDTETYRLQPESPAVDAGTEDFLLSDVDRTRNDIGAYGGMWSIDHFDRQRESESLSPFIYPLIDLSSAVTSNTLQVRALTVAKLK